MNKQTTDEKAGINYALQDEYYLLDLALSADKEQTSEI